MPTGSAARCATSAPSPPSLVAATASAPIRYTSSTTVDATSSRSLSAAHALMAKAAKRAKTDTEMLVVAGYRMGTITSFPLREPVLSSSTTAEIASDSGTMRPIAGTSWPRSWASAMLAMHCVVGLPNTR